MKDNGISVGAGNRLRKAIEAEVRRDLARKLTAMKGFFGRMAVEKKIREEVRKRMKSLTSPYSLYLSTQSPRWKRV